VEFARRGDEPGRAQKAQSKQSNRAKEILIDFKRKGRPEGYWSTGAGQCESTVPGCIREQLAGWQKRGLLTTLREKGEGSRSLPPT